MNQNDEKKGSLIKAPKIMRFSPIQCLTQYAEEHILTFIFMYMHVHLSMWPLIYVYMDVHTSKHYKRQHFCCPSHVCYQQNLYGIILSCCNQGNNNLLTFTQKADLYLAC